MAEALFRAVHHRRLVMARLAAVDCLALRFLSGPRRYFNSPRFNSGAI